MPKMVVIMDHNDNLVSASRKPLVAWNTMRDKTEYQKPAYAEDASGARFNYHAGRFTSFSDWMNQGVKVSW